MTMSMMKSVCIGSRYKTFFLKSVVFIKLHTKIGGMQPVGYGLKSSKHLSLSFPPLVYWVSSSEDAQVGVESFTDRGSETDAILSDESEEEGDMFVVIDEFCE